jgi:hypothetical protein
VATNRPQILWLPRDRVAKDSRQEDWIRVITSDPKHSEGVEIIEDRISAVKDVLLNRVFHRSSSSRIDHVAGDKLPRIYLICDPNDEERTSALEDYFCTQGCNVQLPSFQGEEEDCQSVHLSNLRSCDGAIIYFGSTTRHWVDSHARELIKATGYRESEPIAARVVYVSRPIDTRKDRYKNLTTEVILEGESSDFSELGPFVEQVKKAAVRKHKSGSVP